MLPPENSLEIWTVCFNPSDFPGKYTARRRWIGPGGKQEIDCNVMVANAIEPIREEMRRRGLMRVPRWSDDEPVIVECWL